MKKPRKNKIILVSDFDYHLPKERIGQKPIKPRDSARLLILDKKSGKSEHKVFSDLSELLGKDDVLVLNNSKVIPARLNGEKESGGRVEVFLLKKVSLKNVIASGAVIGEARQSRLIPRDPHGRLITASLGMTTTIWECLVGGKVRIGQHISLGHGIFGEIIEKKDQINLIKFNCSDKKLFSLGVTPTPPYIKQKAKLEDYQTIYAKSLGSVASPTAGLHFTKRLLDKLKKKGVKIEYLTLHVGMGTFAPVKCDNIFEHQMHSELAIVDSKTAKRLNDYKSQGKRIVAVGTTSVRTLEAFSDNKNKIQAGSKWVDIFIYPGYKFKFVDAMITNFHLPKSTLVMLVSAFATLPLIKHAYGEAIKKKYRFYSFGDAMMIN